LNQDKHAYSSRQGSILREIITILSLSNSMLRKTTGQSMVGCSRHNRMGLNLMLRVQVQKTHGEDEDKEYADGGLHRAKIRQQGKRARGLDVKLTQIKKKDKRP
jgi:hypothetical protein